METYKLTTWQYLEVLRQFAFAWGMRTPDVFSGKIVADRLARGYQMAALFAGK